MFGSAESISKYMSLPYSLRILSAVNGMNGHHPAK
jgi:hypothetical protein